VKRTLKAVLISFLISLPAQIEASELPEYRLIVSPYLGEHFFVSDRDFDDTWEAGLRLETFFAPHWSAEVGFGYLSPEDSRGRSREALRYSIDALYHPFLPEETLAPFFILGWGGDTLPERGSGPDLGIGLRYFIQDDLALRLDLRRLFFFDDGGDMMATLGVSYFLDRKKPPAKPGKKAKIEPPKELPPTPPPPPPSPFKGDSDGDGVDDGADACANTPPGEKVDPRGCPLDADGDGVSDSLDKCPDTPSGTKVDASGCPRPVDADRDGVDDAADKCPNTPPDVKTDPSGCPFDSDHDGVFDDLDKCPNTLEGSKVNKEGCIVSITLNVKFDPDQSRIKEEYDPSLERFALFMGENPSLKVEIQGHTDNVGPPEVNLKLSEERAQAVRRLLIEKFGISQERLTAKGYGQDFPLTTNETPEGRAANRRVEAVIK
jgi:OOP family OmpA-OmpF porin